MEELVQKLREFAQERDWDQFHSPKNLSMALIAEAAELIEHFQWVTEDQSYNLPTDQLAEVALELADIQIYLIRLADKLGIDIAEATKKKMAINERKYPVEKAKGTNKKYTKL